MEKRYYIKKTYPNGEVYYATGFDTRFASFKYLEFMKNIKEKERKIFLESEVSGVSNEPLLSGIHSPCTIEFEEIKELFIICNITDTSYFVLDEKEKFELFEDNANVLEFNSFESAKGVYDKLKLGNTCDSYIFRYHDVEISEIREVESNMTPVELRVYNKLNKIREDADNDLSEDIEKIMKKIKDKANITNSNLNKPTVITSEEIKEEYSIVIFQVDENENTWTFIDESLLFRNGKEDIVIYDSIEKATYTYKRIKNDYDCPDYYIRILKRINGGWFDYETGLRIHKINLLLKTMDFLKYKKIIYKGVETDEISKITEIAKSLVNRNE